ncbi:MAG: hypothetical protein U1E30_03360 [Rhodoblastus sp.]
MRKFTLSLLFAFGAFHGAAVAADMPAPVYKGAAEIAAPVRNWTGFYLGGRLSGGYDGARAISLFDPFAGLNNRVGAVNPQADPLMPVNLLGIPGLVAPPVNLLGLPTPPGYQSLTSYTFSAGSNLAWNIFNNAPPGGARSISGTNYSNAPTALNKGNIFGGGGVEFGYDQQIGFAVFGALADFNWFYTPKNARSWQSNGGYSAFASNTSPLWPPGVGEIPYCPEPPYSSCSASGQSQATGAQSSRLDWLSTFRGSAGFSVGRLLTYVTGGLALGRPRLDFTTAWADANQVSGVGCIGIGCASGQTLFGSQALWSGSTAAVRKGWTFGSGFKYALGESAYIKTEALYYDLGKVSVLAYGAGSQYCIPSGLGGPLNACVAGMGNGPIQVAGQRVTKRVSGVIANFGVGYRFW